MDERDPVRDARDLVAQLFPHATWAVVTGSVVTAHRTVGSDLDIVVVLPDGDPAAPHRDSRRYRGWPAELFVHDEATLDHYLAKDLPTRVPTMHRMVATGVPVLGDPGNRRQRCHAVLAAGPPPLSEDERATIRYGLTDSLDDLTSAADEGERAVIAATTWIDAGRHALDLAGHWTGKGKWLLRELWDLDRDLAQRWLTAQGEPARVAAVTREILNRHGGPLFEGHRLAGERPPIIR